MMSADSEYKLYLQIASNYRMEMMEDAKDTYLYCFKYGLLDLMQPYYNNRRQKLRNT